MNTQRNLSKIPQGLENRWVALSPDYKRVLSSGETLSDVMEKVNEKEKSRVIFHKVIPSGYTFSIVDNMPRSNNRQLI